MNVLWIFQGGHADAGHGGEGLGAHGNFGGKISRAI